MIVICDLLLIVFWNGKDTNFLVCLRRESCVANINGFSTMVFIILMTLLTHGHGITFQDRCLGFPKRPCFPKFMKMVAFFFFFLVAHGAPVTDGSMNLGRYVVKIPKYTKNRLTQIYAMQRWDIWRTRRKASPC
jgi:hypothetical protein